MKIKHWQGYGSISARKIREYDIDAHTKMLVIELRGNHEYGLVRDDKYDVFNWLLNNGTRFTKSCKAYTDIENITITEGHAIENSKLIDTATYEIKYRV